ncbi:hypothetical protein IGI04_012261 [Brassica rapa subsp. trilocularis]|uniref:Protein kinase domain-containing protein n=1 Tax=Brassica rapa subsp. trilocularis TaxID=1813537 RepID=A0ABQ7N5F6_BRACM|nr:hypothetical protein IGI04_012261 [Brassica rapa subsp. trilocularis]
MGNSLKSFKRQPHSVAYKRPIYVSENDNLKVFSFTELKKATKNFIECKVVDGDDRSSRKFYKGYIDEYVPSRAGTGITVSVLDVGSSFPLQDREISKHSDLHRSVMFFSTEEEEPLPWEIRVKIAIGVARGVEFIHFIKNKPQYNAKLFYLELNQEDACRLIGGLEYEPRICRLDLKSDVFTLGVILLDLVIGSKDTIRKERRKSIATTRPSLLCDAQKIREIINPRLRNDYPVNAVKEMGILIQRCTKWDKNERPLMQQVLDSLSYIAEFKTSV